jgi:hypothetical protein
MRILHLALLAALPAALGALGAQARPDTATLTARLGVDTISVERIVRSGNGIEAEVVTRSPRTTLQRQRAQFDGRGNLTSLRVVDLNPATGAESRTISYTRHGDSLHIVTQAAERSERMVAAPAEWLPFIDLVHWPFDVALQRMRRAGSTQADAPMLSGQRVSNFPLAMMAGDSATVTHPSVERCGSRFCPMALSVRWTLAPPRVRWS